jgi:hypothetical protein
MKRSGIAWGHARTVFTVLALTAIALQSPAGAQGLFSLGTAQNFLVLGDSAVTNTGASVIGSPTETYGGDLGIYPNTASSITGFPPGTVVSPGTTYAGDAVAMQAQSDTTTSYNVLAGLAPTQNLTGQDLGGLTLTPGVYKFSSSAQLTGTLTLNYEGNPDALFVFQIGSTLTTASSSSVVSINSGGMNGCNVFWQVGSSATLGTDTAFEGSILALASITLDTDATLIDGRVLAQTGAVTLDDNTITAADCPFVPGAAGTFYTHTPPTPEPGAVALFASFGLTAASFMRRKRKR